MDIAPQNEQPSPRADLWGGIVWILLGVAIVWGSWVMDRLPHLQVTFYTIPGLLPGLLGAALAFMGCILLGRAIRAGALQQPARDKRRLAEHWRLAVALGWSLVYAFVLIRGVMPFWLVTAIYVAAFVIVFQFAERRAAGRIPRGIVIAVVYGLISGLLIQYVFEDLFLVRLP